MTDKMTIEQAIICLDFFKSDNPLVDKSERLKLALEMAIEALEKQIPKKPIKDDEWGAFFCPVCEYMLGKYYQGVLNYCDCGQKIDWESDTE